MCNTGIQELLSKHLISLFGGSPNAPQTQHHCLDRSLSPTLSKELPQDLPYKSDISDQIDKLNNYFKLHKSSTIRTRLHTKVGPTRLTTSTLLTTSLQTLVSTTLTLGLLTLSPLSYAGLSATTAGTIQGSAPVFTAVLGENKLGFKVQGTDYSEVLGNISSNTAKDFDAGLTFNDFVVNALTAGDFTVATDYDDSDGDVAHSSTPFTVGTTSHRWLTATDGVIPSSEYNQLIGCGSGYAQPLKLEIKTQGIQVHSQYGDPKDSVLTTLTKTYQIISTSGICYAKPKSLDWWDAGGGITGTPDSANGGGYSSDFYSAKGFKASASTKFPTTGFVGAQFQLVMTGSQSDYTYTVPSHTPLEVSVDSQGNVRLNSKPTGAVTVRATLTSNPTVIHDYTFTPTGTWAVPKAGESDYDTAITKCGTELDILTRAELTNSPKSTGLINVGWSYVTNYYTRAIGGGVFGEWGKTYNINYPGSQWALNYFWMSEVHIAGSRQFLVHSNDGRVNHAFVTTGRYVACRG